METATFSFSDVPSWYALCINSQCPLKDDCLHFLAGTSAPESLETALCVMPKALSNGQCRFYDKKTVAVWAKGFSHLYDHVLKSDYTPIRKDITNYLHGAKQYYAYMRGTRPLSPEQHQWISDYMARRGYEVTFDRYYEAYVFHHWK